MKHIRHAVLLAGIFAVSTAGASGLLDGLKGAASERLQSGGTSGAATAGAGSLLGGLGLPALGGNTLGNAAGVLQYCVKHNYLGGGDAEGVKNALLSKVGLGQEPEKDPGYNSGLSGILSGSDGSTFNLESLQDKVKDKACDYVLDNAKSLI